jgi:hypothetical protein
MERKRIEFERARALAFRDTGVEQGSVSRFLLPCRPQGMP